MLPKYTEYFINTFSLKITGYDTEEVTACLKEYAPRYAKEFKELVDELEIAEAELREYSHPEVDWQLAPQVNLAEENFATELEAAERLLEIAAVFLPKK